MAEVRKSARQVAARKRARTQAAEFRAREDRLEQLAADYFVAADVLDEIDERAEQEIQAVRERAAAERAATAMELDAVAQTMLSLGVSRKEVADRLGIAVRDVKKGPANPRESTSADKHDAQAREPHDGEHG
jgi:DNA-binding CsgD family transcriptional regulator